jgi:hypothetical protein
VLGWTYEECHKCFAVGPEHKPAILSHGVFVHYSSMCFCFCYSSVYIFVCMWSLLREPLSVQITPPPHTHTHKGCTGLCLGGGGGHRGFVSWPDSRELIIFLKVLLKFCRVSHAVHVPQLYLYRDELCFMLLHIHP